MSNTRFEIQLSSYRGGRTLARIYDDYWDGLDTAVFDSAHPEEVNLKAFKERQEAVDAFACLCRNL